MAKKQLSDLQTLLACKESGTLEQALLLDTETTGLGPSTEILELGIVELGTGEVAWEQLYKPSWTDWWGHAEKIHGITQTDVKMKPELYTQMRDLRALVTDKPVLIFNKGHDQPLFPDKLHKASDVICIMLAYQEAFGLSKWQKLVDVAEKHGHDWSSYPPHSAVGDCHATRTVVLAILEKVQSASEAFDKL